MDEHSMFYWVRYGLCLRRSESWCVLAWVRNTFEHGHSGEMLSPGICIVPDLVERAICVLLPS
jgi:hypothetical protein